jgi:hypothetical protein
MQSPLQCLMEITQQQRICDQGIEQQTVTQLVKKVTHISWRTKLFIAVRSFLNLVQFSEISLRVNNALFWDCRPRV